MTRTPRRFMVQDNLEMLPHFTFPRSTNQAEIERLKQQAGKDINIVDHQAAGERVGIKGLELLHGEPQLRKEWARLQGGVTLNAALFMFRETETDDLAELPMYRWFDMPDQDEEGNRLGTEGQEKTTLALLDELQKDTEEYASPEYEDKRSKTAKNRLARRTAQSSLLLAVLDEEFAADEHERMRQIKRLIRTMQNDALRIAYRIGQAPTVAMLRSENTLLGQYIREAATDGSGALSPEMPDVFRQAAAEERELRGY